MSNKNNYSERITIRISEKNKKLLKNRCENNCTTLWAETNKILTLFFKKHKNV